MPEHELDILIEADDIDDLDESAHPATDGESIVRNDYDRGYRDAGVCAVDHWKGVFSAMLTFKGDPRFALICTIAAHGFWDLLPMRDQAEIGAHFGCTRANPNKLTKLIQKRLGLPPTLGQRSDEGCDNMSRQRRTQLEKPLNDKVQTRRD
jgi:hypothetical protein